MRAKANLIAAVFILIICVAGLHFLMRGGKEVAPSPLSFGSTYVGKPPSETYQNAALGFSIEMPEGFHAQEFPLDENAGRTIILQNDSGEGIQIYAVAYPEDIQTLSLEDIRAAIPDMRVNDEQVVQIGANYTGISFKSDNEAFNGDSREVWFVYRGTLYQISTYARLDGLLQAMFATWKFN